MSLTTKQQILPFLPPAILSIALSAIFASHRATMQSNLLSPLLTQTTTINTPPISLLMFDGPGRRIGQIAFPIVGISAILVAIPLRKCIKEVIPPTTNVDNLFSFGAIAFVALSIVGLIPLQRDILLLTTVGTTTTTKMTIDSIVHQSCAAIFFLTSILHMMVWLRLVCFRLPQTCILHYKRNRISFGLKLLCVVNCFLPLPLAFLLHPASPFAVDGASDFDRGGLNQYSLVCCVAFFYASYGLEFLVLQRFREKDDGSAK